MTDSSPYLIARLNALRELLQATQEASAPDPRVRAADWRTSQPQRLERYHQNTQRLRQSAEPDTSALARLALRCDLEPLDEDLLLLALQVPRRLLLLGLDLAFPQLATALI